MTYSPPYIKANWPVHANLVTAVSTCRYTNQALLSKDHAADKQSSSIVENRAHVQQYLNCPQQPTWLKQTHSTHVVCADDYHSSIEADASYTSTPGVVLALRTADCLPIFFYHSDAQMIAVAHAGWRGLTQGIIEKTLKVMPPPFNKIIVWMGPAISREAFEIQEDCAQFFKKSLLQNAIYKQDERYYADLYQAARIILQRNGVEQIYGGEYCTYNMPHSFFSHRRGDTGRCGHLLWINSTALR